MWGTRQGEMSNTGPIKQEKVHSFASQARMGKNVLYEITAEAEEITEHLELMTMCVRRHNNLC